MSRHNGKWAPRCPDCRQPLRYERDLFGGVREWCLCGFAQPLERRAPPPLEPLRNPSASPPSEARRAADRAYYQANRERILAQKRGQYRRKGAA